MLVPNRVRVWLNLLCAIVFLVAAGPVRSQPAHPAATASVFVPLATRVGDLSAQEAELAALVNAHRASFGLPAVPVSRTMTQVAQAHVRDLQLYAPYNGTDSRGMACNLHSWSSHGAWTPVCYTSDHKYASGMWNKPREISGGVYSSSGYENAFGTSGFTATASAAFNAWKSDPSHNNVMIEQDIWQGHHWRAMGVGVYGGFAVLWFGEDDDPLGVILLD